MIKTIWVAMNMYEYTVVGKGHFPIDILRFDGAWPADDASVSKITRSFGPFGHEQTYTVKLYGVSLPTTARWLLLGWHIQDDVLELESIPTWESDR